MTDTEKMQAMLAASKLLSERNAALRDLDAARAEVASLREGQEELARAVRFLDMCNKERIASGDTGAMSDAWQWVEEAAREMIDAAKETP